MADSIFRKKSLARASSPEQLDVLLQVVTPQSLFALAALGLLVAFAVLWGFFGSVPFEVSGQGMLIKEGGVFTIKTQGAGQIKNIYFRPGDNVALGEIVARVDQPELVSRIESARRTVHTLGEKYQATLKYGKSDLELQRQSVFDQRRDLTLANQSLSAQAKWYDEQIKEMIPLVKQGAISGERLFNSQTSLQKILENLRKNELQVGQLTIAEVELSNKIEQQRLTDLDGLNRAKGDLQGLESQFVESSVVYAPYSGRVLGLAAEVGATVARNDPLMTMQVSGDVVSYLEAVIFFPAASGQKLRPGMLMHVAPAHVKVEDFGYIRALVTSVSPFPVTNAEMLRIVQNPAMVEALGKAGPPIEVHAMLLPDTSTPSGFLWTSSAGPPTAIESGNVAMASVIYQRVRPVELIAPFFRKYVLGEHGPENGPQ